MARRRASMREGPLAELFKATEAAQQQARRGEPASAEQQPPRTPRAAPTEPEERTVEHVPSWEEAARVEAAGAGAAVPARPDAAAPGAGARSGPEPQSATRCRRAAPSRRRPRYIEPLPEPPPRLHRVAARATPARTSP